MSLNVANLVDAVVLALQSIPDLVTAMSGDPSRIYAFHYLPGVNKPLKQAIYTQSPNSIMVAWENSIAGNFDAHTIWKHEVFLYLRAGNQAPQVQPNSPPVSYERLWYLICNGPVNSTTQNIRYTQVLLDPDTSSPLVDIPDTPAIVRMEDQAGQDFFVVKFVFPEITTFQNP